MSESIVLDIRDLKSHFFTAKGEIPAVDGVSIEVPAGKIIGIVGESGCGKSMTAMSVMGLLRHPGKVVGGTITLDGFSARWEFRSRRSVTGVIRISCPAACVREL